MPAGPDWPPVSPQLPASYFVTPPTVYTIEAEGVKVSAPYESDALRMFGRVRRAMRRRRNREAAAKAGT